MPSRRDARLATLLGAVTTGVLDHMQIATEQAAGLDGSAPAALVALLDFSPNGSVHALSRIVGLSHSGGVRLVDRLAAAGLVERGPGRDARTVTVTLTRHGIATARKVLRARRAVMLDATRDLGERQRDELLRACETIVAALTRQRLAERARGRPPVGGALCRLCDFQACGRRSGACPAAVAAAPTAEGAT